MDDINFTLCGQGLSRVFRYKYLGCILTSNLSDEVDIDRCFKSFNKSFGGIYRRFSTIDIEVLYFLFNVYCTSFYGAELWTNFYKNLNFKQISMSYHASLKKILRLPKFYSNHFVCSVFNAFTFENLLNFRQTLFLFWLRKCTSPCFYHHKFYFLSNSYFVQRIFKLWYDKYSVINILENDFEALVSRIFYVQFREPSSMYFL